MVRIDPCHGSDPGSIPGSFVFFLFFLLSFYLVRFSTSSYPAQRTILKFTNHRDTDQVVFNGSSRPHMFAPHCLTALRALCVRTSFVSCNACVVCWLVYVVLVIVNQAYTFIQYVGMAFAWLNVLTAFAISSQS